MLLQYHEYGSSYICKISRATLSPYFAYSLQRLYRLRSLYNLCDVEMFFFFRMDKIFRWQLFSDIYFAKSLITILECLHWKIYVQVLMMRIFVNVLPARCCMAVMSGATTEFHPPNPQQLDLVFSLPGNKYVCHSYNHRAKPVRNIQHCSQK